MKISDPTVIAALADLIAANRREREVGSCDGSHRMNGRLAAYVPAYNLAVNDGSHQAGQPVGAAEAAGAAADPTP